MNIRKTKCKKLQYTAKWFSEENAVLNVFIFNQIKLRFQIKNLKEK